MTVRSGYFREDKETDMIMSKINSRCKRIAAWLSAIMIITGLTPGYVMAAEPVGMEISAGVLTSDEAELLNETEPLYEADDVSEGSLLDVTEDGSLEEIMKPAEDDVLMAAPPELPESDDAASVSVDKPEGTKEEVTEAAELEEEPVNEGVIVHEDPVTEYVVTNVVEYNGKQVTKVVSNNYSEIEFIEPAVGEVGEITYKVKYEKDFYESSRVTGLFKGSEKPERGIISYTLVMKAQYRDGSRIKDTSGNEIEDASVTLSANEFKENGYNISLKYNHVYVYANVGAYATEASALRGVVISTPPAVPYTGLQHRLKASTGTRGKTANKDYSFDIDLKLLDYMTGSGECYELVYGKDYYVEYRNNKNASVKYTGNHPESKDYVKLYDSHQAARLWPQVIVTGKGNYRGLKSTVYFDILPASVADGCMAVGPFADGVKESYTLNKAGGINMSVTPARYAVTYNNMTYSYVINTGRTIRYRLMKDVIVELQKKDGTTGNWERLGDLTDSAKRRDTLRSVTQEGDYRIQVTGIGNFHGKIYDTFKVFGNGKMLFGSLKLQTVTATCSSDGVKAEALVRGISTAVRNAAGARTKISLSECSITLEPASESAIVGGNGTVAMSAGKYTVSVKPKNEEDFRKKYPPVAIDGSATATVTVKGARLDKKMFAVSWNRAGEVCDGMPKDVEITLKGIKAGDVTPAKMIVRNGRKVYVPLSDKELGTAFKTNGNDKIIISGSYTLDDGRVMDNTLPGRYSIALYGKNGYADSVWVYTYIRTGAVLTFDRLSANAVSYNASGAMTEILITMPDGKSVERIAGTGDDRFKVEYRSNKATGNATAIVRVRNSATGYRKGSVARVSFPIKAKEVTKVYPYDAYTNDMAGEVFIKTAGTLKKGYKGRSFTLYQASADGKKLVALNSRNYKGSLSANTAGQYDLKIENGHTGYFNFKDVTVKGVYTEYKAQARKWTAQNALVLSTDAVIIKDAGDGRVYDSKYITGSENTVVSVTRTGKGVFSVPYAGGSYILPWMPELTVDGKKLSFTAGDYVISYKNNNRIGTASMTVTITQTGAAKHGIGGSRTYTFKIVPQKSMSLNL